MKWISALFLVLSTSCIGGSPKKTEQTAAFTNATACLFSQLAYCHEPSSKAQQYLPGWKIIWNAIALNGNHALVATDGAKYVVAIRGSLMEFSWDAFENWIYQDLNIATQEDWPYCDKKNARISTGSYRGWQNITKIKDRDSGIDLLSFLLKKTKQADSIYITGHSLGGNLATVYASYLHHQFLQAGRLKPAVNVITFAAPAAGNDIFADDFDKKFPDAIRIESKNDIVPKFPCTSAVAALGNLYGGKLSANEILVGYQNLSVSLSTVFKSISTAMVLMEYKNGISFFKQTSNDGTTLDIPLSGNNTNSTIGSWFSEAGYQHGIAQYARALGVETITCQ
jgi:triacylglycerol lipase